MPNLLIGFAILTTGHFDVGLWQAYSIVYTADEM